MKLFKIKIKRGKKLVWVQIVQDMVRRINVISYAVRIIQDFK